MMVILTGEDAARIKLALTVLRAEIARLRNNDIHPEGCGCKECDHLASAFGKMEEIGKE